MSTSLALLLGMLLDRRLGEVSRWHPLVGFGCCAGRLEGILNRGRARILRGAIGWSLLVVPPVALAALLTRLPLGWLIDAIALYFALGGRALAEHGNAVAIALRSGDLDEARRRTGMIVSRDTRAMDEEQISRATVESLLENGNDAVFGALFWCVLAGAPGVLLFRLANTLDAMWGYRNARFEGFGKCAARIDDLLNYIPARLTALSYALLGHTRAALACWRRQAPAWSSPNAGPVMAAGAGSLGLRLGGAASYAGELEQRPLLGEGRPAGRRDIQRAIALVSRSALLWLAVIVSTDVILHAL